MGLTASEQATLYFYQWEYRNRGYYHFDTPIDIEPPYLPFSHQSYTTTSVIDDGRAPSLFGSIKKLLSPKEIERPKEDTGIPDIVPTILPFDEKPKLVGFSLSFPKEQEIFPLRNREFLNMLSFSISPVSFEILGNAETIVIQIVCNVLDAERIQSQLKAYFPRIILIRSETDSFGFNTKEDIAIADFGISDEFMRPITTTDSFGIDPLTPIIATLDSLQGDDIALFQMIFKGITSPLARDIPYSVSDGAGGSFFSDAPEMPKCASEKISAPLFSVVMRIAVQGNTTMRSQYLTQQLAQSISNISRSEYNRLIPLSNEGYSYDFHYYNVHHRLSNRLGFILNSNELSTFVHYPNKSVVSSKLGVSGGKTKALPKEAINQKYVLGINEHNGVETGVTLNDEARLRHTHIIGATGVGKSTLIANMMIEDMKAGNGCALFDPHGDIVEDVLLRIPEQRKDDVILIDPYDTEFPIGFNILHATTDAEKIVLSSDLVSAFKRFATSWGDNMSSVLSQAVNTFLESTTGGTLIELKRFLLEDAFRKQFLENVDDPSIHYYWEHEYGYLKKRIAPLLTRIDTFLRPKIVRYMLAQKGGVDFRDCIDEKKIVLIKLSQGLIGEENSYLLGSLFLSKFNQVAQSRQNIPKHERHPYYIYCDEFHNLITPSISQILSGARKYGLGLILAHQETAQIDDYKVLNSVISNPHIRICFRLGDSDAKKLHDGFSYFDQNDLQSLGIGQAIARIGRSDSDFNLTTFPLVEKGSNSSVVRKSIIQNTRSIYAKPRVEVEELLVALLPKAKKKKQAPPVVKVEIDDEPKIINKEELKIDDEPIIPKKISDEVKDELIRSEELSIRNRDHSYLQNVIKKLGQERNFIATIEKETQDGGRIDITLEKGVLRVAFEISITNTPQYEVKNIKKCLADGYVPVVMVSKNQHHLNAIERLAQQELSEEDISYVLFIQPHKITNVLDDIDVSIPPKQEVIKGFRITTEFESSSSTNIKGIRQHIAKMLSRKK